VRRCAITMRSRSLVHDQIAMARAKGHVVYSQMLAKGELVYRDFGPRSQCHGQCFVI